MRTKEPGSGALWPLGPLAAIVAVPVVLLALLLFVAILRKTAGWPGRATEGAVLAGILVLALLPVVLLLIDRVAGAGGQVEAFGVRVQFAAAVGAQRQAFIPPTLGLQEGEALNDTSTVKILDTLRQAARSDLAVVDLGEGRKWWETRLLVLCAGAARMDRPGAVVFVETAGGKDKVYLGWARPRDLVESLLQAREDFRPAYYTSLAVARQWDLAIPPVPSVEGSPGEQARLPFPIGPDSGVSQIVYPQLTPTPNQLAAEQILAQRLGGLEMTGRYGLLFPSRLQDLFRPVLRTRSVDLGDETTRDAAWAADLLRGTDPYIAVTRDEQFVGLLPREQALSAVLRSVLLSMGSDGSAPMT